MSQTNKNKEDLILNKKRRKRAKLVDKLLWCFYQVHSTITLRRFKKKREVKKVLVYAAGFIGDTVIAHDVLNAIKRKYPGTTIVINKGMNYLFPEFNIINYTPPWLNYGERINFKGMIRFFSFIRKLKKQKFDLALDIRGDMRNNLILYLSKAPARVGYGNTGGKYFLTDPVALTDNLEVNRYKKLAKAIGAEPSEYPSLSVDKSSESSAFEKLKKERMTKKSKYVVLIPSAGYWTKEWELSNWIKVVDEIDTPVILLGAPSDKKFSEIAQKSRKKVVDMIGKYSLNESAAIMKHAALVLGPDTGAIHLAAAVGADTLTLFGPTRPQRWQAYGSGSNQIIDKKQWCSPCGRLNECPIQKECMKKIKSKDVAKKITAMVKNK